MTLQDFKTIHNINVSALANAMGMKVPTLHAKINGDYKMKPKEFQKMERALYKMHKEVLNDLKLIQL